MNSAFLWTGLILLIRISGIFNFKFEEKYYLCCYDIFNYLLSIEYNPFIFLEPICDDRTRWCNFVSPWECKADKYLNEICPSTCNLCNHDGNFTSAKKNGRISKN